MCTEAWPDGLTNDQPLHSGTGEKQMNTGAVYCLSERQPSKRKPACKIYTFNDYNRPLTCHLTSRRIKHHPQHHHLFPQHYLCECVRRGR